MNSASQTSADNVATNADQDSDCDHPNCTSPPPGGIVPKNGSKTKSKKLGRLVTPNISLVPRRGRGTVRPEDNPNAAYPNNQICTSKYTKYNFLVKNAIEQFRRFANIYFGIIQLINWLPGLCAPRNVSNR